MNSAVDATFPYMCILPESPIMIDTFIAASDYCKLTITRSAWADTTNTMGTVSPKNAELNAPNGIANMPEALRMRGISATAAPQDYYTPAGDEFAGLPSPGSRSHQNYAPDFLLANAGFYNSELSPPYVNKILGARATAPCINFFLVDINEQAAKAMQTTV